MMQTHFFVSKLMEILISGKKKLLPIFVFILAGAVRRSPFDTLPANYFIHTILQYLAFDLFDRHGRDERHGKFIF